MNYIKTSQGLSPTSTVPYFEYANMTQSVLFVQLYLKAQHGINPSIILVGHYVATTLYPFSHYSPFSSVPNFHCSVDNYLGILLRVFSGCAKTKCG